MTVKKKPAAKKPAAKKPAEPAKVEMEAVDIGPGSSTEETTKQPGDSV